MSAERARSLAACRSWLTCESRADTLFPLPPASDEAQRTRPMPIPIPIPVSPLEERSTIVGIDEGNDKDGRKICLRIMFVVVLRTAIFPA